MRLIVWKTQSVIYLKKNTFLGSSFGKKKKCVSHYGFKLCLKIDLFDIIYCSSEERESAHFASLTVTFIDSCLAGGISSVSPTHKPQSAALTPYKYSWCVSATALSELIERGQSERGDARGKGARVHWYRRGRCSSQELRRRQKRYFKKYKTWFVKRLHTI